MTNIGESHSQAQVGYAYGHPVLLKSLFLAPLQAPAQSQGVSNVYLSIPLEPRIFVVEHSLRTCHEYKRFPRRFRPIRCNQISSPGFR